MKIRIEFEIDSKDYKAYEYILNDFELQIGDLGYDLEVYETDK